MFIKITVWDIVIVYFFDCLLLFFYWEIDYNQAIDFVHPAAEPD